ncbi:septal ring lytic transglycosylase RlpA family protein [Methylocaldum sp.]|uniref:septal ring lytic transglycosylase RlpA family protein n=1 Tax=Methylocaldum sp. TaxID=1969727 RepID=UPI002D507746|nr:septal ring lytic transglycosylase RlpA family protein [Methylocaldum sp.]HYE35801.1 septal ring lytic transglycosylase RlpA family protein [Methylocaldum sp.]
MRKLRLIANSLLSIYLASSCTVGHARTASPKNPASSQKGTASYYSDRFQGRRTASGERYNKNGFTAMHRSLPFGTRLRVTNLSNNRSIEVRVNDRGDPANRRLLDLSRRAASELGFIRAGLAQVKLEVIQPGDG